MNLFVFDCFIKVIVYPSSGQRAICLMFRVPGLGLAVAALGACSFYLASLLCCSWLLAKNAEQRAQGKKKVSGSGFRV